MGALPAVMGTYMGCCYSQATEVSTSSIEPHREDIWSSFKDLSLDSSLSDSLKFVPVERLRYELAFLSQVTAASRGPALPSISTLATEERMEPCR